MSKLSDGIKNLKLSILGGNIHGLQHVMKRKWRESITENPTTRNFYIIELQYGHLNKLL